MPWGPNHCVAPKSPTKVENVFFNTVHSLSKDLRLDHGGAKLVSFPGRHLTSVGPCVTPWTSGVTRGARARAELSGGRHFVD